MQRRRFLASSVSASALAVQASTTRLGAAQSESKNSREYYQLRHYALRSGPQRRLLDTYLRDALIPGLNRMDVRPVGVFSTTIGPENPSVYVLVPSMSVENLVLMDQRLDQDAAYAKAAAEFLNASAKEPPFERMSSSLLRAFEGKPKLTVPPVTAEKGDRVFELRTYESPSDQDHKRKVEMFHSGEFDLFEKSGFWQVFYGDKLIGDRMPCLTYMIGFPTLADRDKKWSAFFSAPEWKKLSGSARFNFEPIVSNTTNLILTPTGYSQI
jgi:NIPSNAP